MITERQIEARRGGLGASDMAIVLGLSPFGSAWELVLEKNGKLDPRKDTASLDIGRALESVVLDWAEQQKPWRLERDPDTRHCIAGSPILAHFDAIAIGEDGEDPMEAKTAGVLFDGILKDPVHAWGEPWTDDVPDHIIIQCTSQLACTRSNVCWVPALIGGRGFAMYKVGRDQGLVDILRKEADHFWNTYVVPCKRPPSGPQATAESVLKRIRRQPDSSCAVPADMVERWLKAKADRKEVEKAEKDAKARLLEALGECDGGDGGTAGTVTYYQDKRGARTLRHRKAGS